MFILIVFLSGCDRLTLLLSTLTPLFLPFSSVSLSYFILAVPMRTTVWENTRVSFQFPIAILNNTLFFRETKMSKVEESPVKN